MGPPSPRREAFRILRRVEDAGAFASVLLERPAVELNDPRDVSLLVEIVLGVLRRRSQLDYAIAAAAARPLNDVDRAVLTALRIGAYALLFLDRIPDFAAVDTAVALVKDAGLAKAAGFANGVLRRVAREGQALLPQPPKRGDVEGLAVYRSHPTWLADRMVARAGWDDADALMAANNEPAATVLVPWPDAGASTALAAALQADDVHVAPCRFVPGALRVVSGVPPRAAAFREGGCFIQDEASQLAGSMFGGAVGPSVLDVCAAPGGKTLSLASRLVEGGWVVAADRHVKRLLRLSQNVSRLRAANVLPLAADMSRPSPLSCLFDDVLVDAPCSGTGTLRRHPEIRWRLKPEELPMLARRQLLILRAASALVRPGGRLVYSVCSVEPEEGESVIAAFLDEHAEFVRADPRAGLLPAARTLIGADLALRTAPTDDGMDGFFAALLTRRSN